MRVTQLNIYPVKSLRGIALEAATLMSRGFALDRHWMVVDDDDRFVTQRDVPAMAQVGVRLESHALVLEHADAEPLAVELDRQGQPRLTVSIWNDRCDALDEGTRAAAWLTAVLGRPKGSGLRLVRFPDDHRRDVAPDHLQNESAEVGFADGFPFLVTSDASLEGLNERLVAKGLDGVPMSRFRPNIVVRGDTPFDEREWHELEGDNGGIRLGLRKPCQRCQIITQDQLTGEAPVPKEPLKSLVEMATQPGTRGAFFGQNAILLAGEGRALCLGDRLDVTRRREPESA